MIVDHRTCYVESGKLNECSNLCETELPGAV